MKENKIGRKLVVVCIIAMFLTSSIVSLPIVAPPAYAMTQEEIKPKEELENRLFENLKEMAEAGIETELIKKGLTTLLDKAPDINKVATAYAESKGWYEAGYKDIIGPLPMC